VFARGARNLDQYHHLKEHHVSRIPADQDVLPGASATVREIDQQPEVWMAVSQIVEAHRADLGDFLERLLAQPDLRIVLTGAGTSAFVGEIAAPALARLLGRRVDAVATTDIVSDPRGSFPQDVPTLLVSFARSGNSPESIAATELADQILGDVSHLILTCDESGALYQQHTGRASSLVLLMPERANDEGFAMTSSFTSMLLAVLLAFGGANDAAVSALVAAGRHILESNQDAIDALVAQPFERVVYLGSGALAGLARESALKLLELTAGRVVGYSESALGFRHGPKAILNDRTLIVVYVSSDPYTRQYDLDILAELRGGAQPQNVVAISALPVGAPAPGSWILHDGHDIPDAFVAIALVVYAQLLALRFSERLGLTPDNPFPGGDVNRVVQGVHIHTLEA
jgi:tagatose-6-phosphate ketose/aldose isomerase